MILRKRECSLCEVMLVRCLSTVVFVLTYFHAQHLIRREEAFNAEERAVASMCIIQDSRNCYYCVSFYIQKYIAVENETDW